jgi:uncharacterized protein (DUF2147 family)
VTRILFMMLTGIFLLLAGAAWGGGDDILGQWNNEDGKAKIEISPCGVHYCGKISWLKQSEYPADDPGGMAGQPRVDRDNPDPALRGRRLLGLPIMEGFSYDGKTGWDKGSIYDPKNGKTYRCKMKLVSPQRLDIRGYVGIPLFGRTTTWTR